MPMESQRKEGECYECRAKGHWANNCPLRAPTYPVPPVVICECGGGICLVKISKTGRNPGRFFYKCPRCRCFKWCDELPNGYPRRRYTISLQTDENKIDAIQVELDKSTEVPLCECKAGPCRTYADTTGRKYYACSIKKGQGECGHFKWCDEMDARENSQERNKIVTRQPTRGNTRNNACFGCGSEDHRVKDCPSRIAQLSNG